MLGESAVPPSTEDKAEGRTATASSRESGERTAENAVDGDSGSRWSSAWQEGQWWQVDLGAARAVSSVEIEWENAYAASFRVLTSDDGQQFSVAASAGASGAGRQVVSFGARSARFVRIQSLQRGTQYGISFWEVEVHGPADGTDPGPGSVEPEPGGSDPGSSDPGPGDGDPTPGASDGSGASDGGADSSLPVGPSKGLRGGKPTSGDSPTRATPGAARSPLRLFLRLRRVGHGARAAGDRSSIQASGRTVASVAAARCACASNVWCSVAGRRSAAPASACARAASNASSRTCLTVATA